MRLIYSLLTPTYFRCSAANPSSILRTVQSVSRFQTSACGPLGALARPGRLAAVLVSVVLSGAARVNVTPKEEAPSCSAPEARTSARHDSVLVVTAGTVLLLVAFALCASRSLSTLLILFHRSLIRFLPPALERPAHSFCRTYIYLELLVPNPTNRTLLPSPLAPTSAHVITFFAFFAFLRELQLLPFAHCLSHNDPTSDDPGR